MCAYSFLRRISPARQRSDSQALAALCTASIDDLTAILGAHAGQKAMNFLALTLLGLKSSLHGCILRKNSSPVMGSILVPKWGQACNSTVYRTLWPSVKHFFRFPSNFFEKPLWRNFQLFHPFPVENFLSTISCGFSPHWTQGHFPDAGMSFLCIINYLI